MFAVLRRAFLPFRFETPPGNRQLEPHFATLEPPRAFLIAGCAPLELASGALISGVAPLFSTSAPEIVGCAALKPAGVMLKLASGAKKIRPYALKTGSGPLEMRSGAIEIARALRRFFPRLLKILLRPAEILPQVAKTAPRRVENGHVLARMILESCRLNLMAVERRPGCAIRVTNHISPWPSAAFRITPALMKLKSLSPVFAITAVVLLTGCANRERKRSDQMWTSVAGPSDVPNREHNDAAAEHGYHANPDHVDREEYARKFDAEPDTF